MDRRVFLSLALSSAWLSLTKPFLSGGIASSLFTDKGLAWRNWSGNLFAFPQKRLTPKNESQLKTIIARAPKPIRAVGAGHSFSPLVPSQGTLVSLDFFKNVLSYRDGQTYALCGAGGRLQALSRDLARSGRAFRNLPDIDLQSLAGAISTATHGTGADFGSLSSEVRSLTLMTAKGEEIECSARNQRELFLAAKTSLGVLGLLTKIEMRVEPSFKLHRQTWFEPYHALMARARNLFFKHRHFEFYYIPFTDYCLAISHDQTDKEASFRPQPQDDEGVQELKFLRDWLSWTPSLRRQLGQSAIADAPTENLIGQSYEMLSTIRHVRFNEMEYHMPLRFGLEALDEVKNLIEKDFPDIFFPLECRIVKAEDSWLSPFQKDESHYLSIAVHAYYKDPYLPLFRAIEPIFLKKQGRPHWGKMSFLKARDFEAIYPQWQAFKRLRRQADPKGHLLNDYLKDLFL